jgi:hypothetical protein
LRDLVIELVEKGLTARETVNLQQRFHARPVVGATAYWQDACDTHTPLWFCRTTMLALVRLLSQSKLMGADELNLLGAMAV